MDIGRIVIELAKEYNIHAVRLRFNWGKISVQRKILSAVYNTRLRFNNLAKTSYFCEIKDVTNQLINKNVPTEVMVHPYPGGNGRILNYKNGPDLGSLITKYLVKKDFITYDYLVRKSAGTG